MPKYLVRANYTASGAAGLLKDGGSGRVEAITALVKSGGGTIEAIYWVMGDDDIIIIVDAPDVEAVAAVSLNVGASGAAECSTSELLTAAQMDEIAKRQITYRAPGA
jgi:uncharacterized protein with GYD domain